VNVVLNKLFVPVLVCSIVPLLLIVSTGLIEGIFNPVALDNKPVQLIADELEILPVAAIVVVVLIFPLVSINAYVFAPAPGPSLT